MFADGHDLLAGVLKYRAARRPSGRRGSEVAARRRSATTAGARRSPSPSSGEYEYTVEGVDRPLRHRGCKALIAKADAGQDVASELLEGAELVQAAAAGARQTRAGPTRDLRLLEIADLLRSTVPQAARVAAARDPRAARADGRAARSQRVHDLRPRAARHRRPRARALRRLVRDVSALVHARPVAQRHVPRRRGAAARHRGDGLRRRSTCRPIHPIGRTHRKGRNNSLTPAPGDPGSPWAIGSERGRPHRDRARARHARGLRPLRRRPPTRLGLEVALDIAFQASPDHPWVREHPEWFKHRPDGTIKYAENPPKKYQDIYPLDFESRDWRSLWDALRDVFLLLDRARRARSSASTTRTRSRSASGSGASPRSSARIPTRSSSPRRSRGRR